MSTIGENPSSPFIIETSLNFESSPYSEEKPGLNLFSRDENLALNINQTPLLP
jgi:hypothetical protein